MLVFKGFQPLSIEMFSKISTNLKKNSSLADLFVTVIPAFEILEQHIENHCPINVRKYAVSVNASGGNDFNFTASSSAIVVFTERKWTAEPT